jgi:hypothetical protein
MELQLFDESEKVTRPKKKPPVMIPHSFWTAPRGKTEKDPAKSKVKK